MEQLEPDTEGKIIDITDYAERPPNDKRSPQHAPKHGPHSVTQEPFPTPPTSLSYLAMNVTTTPAKPHHMEMQGILLDKRKHHADGLHV